MITNIKNGWCDFEIGSFKKTISYRTDVPVELLSAFLDYSAKQYGIAWLEDQHGLYALMLTPCGIFIYEDHEEPIVHTFYASSVCKLMFELIEDIEENIDNWATFIDSICSDDVTRHRALILEKLRDLKAASDVFAYWEGKKEYELLKETEKNLISLVMNQKMSIQEAAETLNISPQEFLRKLLSSLRCEAEKHN